MILVFVELAMTNKEMARTAKSRMARAYIRYCRLTVKQSRMDQSTWGPLISKKFINFFHVFINSCNVGIMFFLIINLRNLFWRILNYISPYFYTFAVGNCNKNTWNLKSCLTTSTISQLIFWKQRATHWYYFLDCSTIDLNHQIHITANWFKISQFLSSPLWNSIVSNISRER